MKDLSINQLVEFDRNLSELVKKYDIKDSSKTVARLHEENKLDADFFLELVNMFSNGDYFPTEQLSTFPVPLIIDYLKKTHIYYLQTRLPEMEQMIDHLFKNSSSPISQLLKGFFSRFQRETYGHILKEESELFPYLLQLYNGETKTKGKAIENHLNSHDHEVEDELLEMKKKIVEQHSDAEQLLPFRLLLHQMDLFENDLRVHAKVEDDILIPIGLKMEKELPQV